MMDKLLPLLQLCDSNFPSGAFSHSFGFETYISNEKINNYETFHDALCVYIQTQLTYTDGLACRLICREIYRFDIWNDDKKKRGYMHPALVFAIFCYHLEIPKDTTVLSYLYTSVQALVQNAVRGIPLGQTDGQRLLVSVQPHLIKAVQKIHTLTEEELGAVAPGLEIAQMQHEQLSVRLFMS
jgi:urease accessory protein